LSTMDTGSAVNNLLDRHPVAVQAIALVISRQG